MSESSERFLDNSKKYLAFAEDRKGDLDFKAYEDSESFNEALTPLTDEGYVGVVAIGSRTRGFPSKGSDSDVIVLYDLSKGGPKRRAYDNFTQAVYDKLGNEGVAGRNIHPIFTPIDRVHVAETLSQILESTPIFEERLGYLFGQSVIGPLVEQYKRDVAREIKNMRPDEQEMIIGKLAESIIEAEQGSDQKVRNRLPELRRSNALDNLAAARLEMWKEQIREAVRLYA